MIIILTLWSTKTSTRIFFLCQICINVYENGSSRSSDCIFFMDIYLKDLRKHIFACNIRTYKQNCCCQLHNLLRYSRIQKQNYDGQCWLGTSYFQSVLKEALNKDTDASRRLSVEFTFRCKTKNKTWWDYDGHSMHIGNELWLPVSRCRAFTRNRHLAVDELVPDDYAVSCTVLWGHGCTMWPHIACSI